MPSYLIKRRYRQEWAEPDPKWDAIGSHPRVRAFCIDNGADSISEEQELIETDPDTASDFERDFEVFEVEPAPADAYTDPCGMVYIVREIGGPVTCVYDYPEKEACDA